MQKITIIELSQLNLVIIIVPNPLEDADYGILFFNLETGYQILQVPNYKLGEEIEDFPLGELGVFDLSTQVDVEQTPEITLGDDATLDEIAAAFEEAMSKTGRQAVLLTFLKDDIVVSFQLKPHVRVWANPMKQTLKLEFV